MVVRLQVHCLLHSKQCGSMHPEKERKRVSMLLGVMTGASVARSNPRHQYPCLDQRDDSSSSCFNRRDTFNKSSCNGLFFV